MGLIAWILFGLILGPMLRAATIPEPLLVMAAANAGVAVCFVALGKILRRRGPSLRVTSEYLFVAGCSVLAVAAGWLALRVCPDRLEVGFAFAHLMLATALFVASRFVEPATVRVSALIATGFVLIVLFPGHAFESSRSTAGSRPRKRTACPSRSRSGASTEKGWPPGIS